jgi:hypothetical protein
VDESEDEGDDGNNDSSSYPTNSHTTILEDSNGYKIEVTVNIGSWVKGADSDVVENSWRSVGGDGAMPIGSGEYKEGQSGGMHKFNPDTSAYIFGNLTIRNASPEYPISNYGNGYCFVTLNFVTYPRGNFPSATSMTAPVTGVQYSNKTNTNWGNNSVEFTPTLSSNNVGPIPFAIGIENVFSPKTPDGNPLLEELFFQPGNGFPVGEPFQVENTW